MGYSHTYNWTEEVLDEETVEDMERFSDLEIEAIQNSYVVIMILPAGRGTHIEIGIALALNKTVYLWSEDEMVFDVKDTVNFYFAKGVTRVVGGLEDFVKEITTTSQTKKRTLFKSN